MTDFTTPIYQELLAGTAFNTAVSNAITATSSSLTAVLSPLQSAGASPSQLAQITALTQEGGALDVISDHINVHLLTFSRNGSVYSNYANLQESLGNITAEDAANGVGTFFGSLLGSTTTILDAMNTQVTALQAAASSGNLSSLNAIIASLNASGTSLINLAVAEVTAILSAIEGSVDLSQAGSIIATATDPNLTPVVQAIASPSLLEILQQIATNNMTSLGFSTADDDTPVSSDSTPFSD